MRLNSSHLHCWAWCFVKFLFRCRRFRNTILLPSFCSSISVFQLLKITRKLMFSFKFLSFFFFKITETERWHCNAKYLSLLPLQLFQLHFWKLSSSFNFQVFLKELKVISWAKRENKIITGTNKCNLHFLWGTACELHFALNRWRSPEYS